MGYFKTLKEQRERDRERNPENKPTQFYMLMRFVCGGYLFYLIYQIISEGGLKETEGWMRVLMICGLVAFAVVGAWCIWQGIKMLIKNDFYNPNAPYPNESESVDRPDELSEEADRTEENEEITEENSN